MIPLTVTPSAAAQIRELVESKGFATGTHGLRLYIEKGGCAGLQYAMKVGTAQPGDVEIRTEGALVLLAADSVDFLRGSEIDYADTLNDSGFKIHNPNAARSCGCGTSFEPAGAGAASGADAR